MYRLPLPVRPGLVVSPDCMVRGVRRAQAAACPGVGNIDGSVPSSAMMTWALRSPTPVISSSRCVSGSSELRYSFVSILSANDVRMEDISDLVGHSSTSVTETVYRHEIRPALTDNATAVNRILKANATELVCPCSGKSVGSPIGSRNLNLKTCLTSRDGGI